MTRDTVVGAGEQMLERGHDLSLRRLAVALDASPAALYYHVPGGVAELLGAIAARVLDRCTQAAVQAAAASARGDALGNALVAIHGVVAGRPALARVAASRRCGTADLHAAWWRLIDTLAEPSRQPSPAVPRGVLSALVMTLFVMAARSQEPRHDLALDVVRITLAGAGRLAAEHGGAIAAAPGKDVR